jgi:hypothetical protein
MAMHSTGGSAGFADSKTGDAVGRASGGASGSAAGTDLPPAEYSNFRDLIFNGSSAVKGNCTFLGGFSTPEPPNATGGAGSGSGTLNVAGSGNGAGGNDSILYGLYSL